MLYVYGVGSRDFESQVIEGHIYIFSVLIPYVEMVIFFLNVNMCLNGLACTKLYVFEYGYLFILK